MKLKPFDRFTSAVFLLALIAFCGLCAGIAWGILDPRVFAGFAALLTSGLLASVLVTAAAAVVLLLCLRILFVRQRDRQPTPPQAPGILVRQGEAGSVFLSLPALEEIVLRTVRANTRIRNCHCELLPGETAVRIRVSASLAPDANIPEVTAAVQDTVKTNVQELCGIDVSEVQFVVERADVAAASLPEVRARVQ